MIDTDKHYFSCQIGSKMVQKLRDLSVQGTEKPEPTWYRFWVLRLSPPGTCSYFERMWMWESELTADANLSLEIKFSVMAERSRTYMGWKFAEWDRRLWEGQLFFYKAWASFSCRLSSEVLSVLSHLQHLRYTNVTAHGPHHTQFSLRWQLEVIMSHVRSQLYPSLSVTLLEFLLEASQVFISPLPCAWKT